MEFGFQVDNAPNAASRTSPSTVVSPLALVDATRQGLIEDGTKNFSNRPEYDFSNHSLEGLGENFDFDKDWEQYKLISGELFENELFEKQRYLIGEWRYSSGVGDGIVAGLVTV